MLKLLPGSRVGSCSQAKQLLLQGLQQAGLIVHMLTDEKTHHGVHAAEETTF
jgi:hypothetical protein